MRLSHVCLHVAFRITTAAEDASNFKLNKLANTKAI